MRATTTEPIVHAKSPSTLSAEVWLLALHVGRLVRPHTHLLVFLNKALVSGFYTLGLDFLQLLFTVPFFAEGCRIFVRNALSFPISVSLTKIFPLVTVGLLLRLSTWNHSDRHVGLRWSNNRISLNTRLFHLVYNARLSIRDWVLSGRHYSSLREPYGRDGTDRAVWLFLGRLLIHLSSLWNSLLFFLFNFRTVFNV